MVAKSKTIAGEMLPFSITPLRKTAPRIVGTSRPAMSPKAAIDSAKEVIDGAEVK